MEWGFYGRRLELQQLAAILERRRWFFVTVTGRRRIGKTSLIQQALLAARSKGIQQGILYVQIPDSGPAGVVSAVVDAMDTFHLPDSIARPASLDDVAKLVSTLARLGYVIALDEFQYFNREHLKDFPSLLQREVDLLSAGAARVPGGLLVLGSVHTDIQALLEHQSAPLFSRTTGEIDLTHLDLSSVLEILNEHATPDPQRLLFLWSLFEGVPKFYRDCYEQGVLSAGRGELLRKLFFESSSPLRTEADNWFLKELRGRYDVVLKHVARNEGCNHGEITDYVRRMSRDTEEQVAGYLKILIERYRLIERKLPVFAKPKTPRGRYYLTDNFLAAWLAALANPVSAIACSPTDQLVVEADQRMRDVEGHAFEKLVERRYEERSKKRIGDFPLSRRIDGYWDSSDTEIDLVAMDETSKRIRFGTCKRSEDKLLKDVTNFEGHVSRFLETYPGYKKWKIEKAALSPELTPEARRHLQGAGLIPQDLADLLLGL